MKRTKLITSCIVTIILACSCLSYAVAQTPPYTFENGDSAASRGVIEVGEAKFDSTDLGEIYTEVNNGKTAIAQQMTATAGVPDLSLKDNGIYTFTKLVSGVDATYNNGKSATWSDIRDAADGTNLPTEFNSVTDIDSLKTAVTASNEAYAVSYVQSDEGKQALREAGIKIITSEYVQINASASARVDDYTIYGQLNMSASYTNGTFSYIGFSTNKYGTPDAMSSDGWYLYDISKKSEESRHSDLIYMSGASSNNVGASGSFRLYF